MKKFFKFLGVLVLLLTAFLAFYYFSNNEEIPTGKKGPEAEALATKMTKAINSEAFHNAEILEWSFRGKNHYKWYKQEGKVEVKLGDDNITLDLKDTSKSVANSQELVKKALKNFNNDSFWLVAPHKVFDKGVERSLVNYKGKDALLVTYTSGGSTPGDSYLWILDENGFPTDYKMWVKIIPIGGVSATWNDWKETEAGFKLPTKHKLSLFGMELDMGEVKASNPNADALANKILKAINHEAYKKTKYLEWSFGGRRSYKWNKEEHIVDVFWDTYKVTLHPNDISKSIAFINQKTATNDMKLIKKAEDYFNNDSFWLVAPHKLFDNGTIRTVKKENGKDALLVKYTSGGTTPGDSYLWILDENNVPESYKMYVPSMKMNGVSSTWEDWIYTESGTMLPKNHSFGNGGKLSMGDVKGYN